MDVKMVDVAQTIGKLAMALNTGGPIGSEPEHRLLFMILRAEESDPSQCQIFVASETTCLPG
jgi:hypothetical protein